MVRRATVNFHFPLPLIRQRERLHEEIAAFASEYAGSDLDLDEDLERAGLETLKGLAPDLASPETQKNTR